MNVVLAGTGSAVGKTTISTGIMKALSDKNVQAFKVGPESGFHRPFISYNGYWKRFQKSRFIFHE